MGSAVAAPIAAAVAAATPVVAAAAAEEDDDQDNNPQAAAAAPAIVTASHNETYLLLFCLRPVLPATFHPMPFPQKGAKNSAGPVQSVLAELCFRPPCVLLPAQARLKAHNSLSFAAVAIKLMGRAF